jgi:hypothetical protein
MGVRAGIAADQRPFGISSAVVVTVDENGTELAREVVPNAPGTRAVGCALRRPRRRSVRKLQCQSALGLVITQWSDRLGLAPPLPRSPRGYADRDA